MECSDIYSKAYGGLSHHYRDESALNNVGGILVFLLIIRVFCSKNRHLWHKIVEIIASLKYVSNFWKTLEKRLIN